MRRQHRPIRFSSSSGRGRVQGSSSPRRWAEWWHAHPSRDLRASPSTLTVTPRLSPATTRGTIPRVSIARMFLLTTGILPLFLSPGGIVPVSAELCSPTNQTMTVLSSTVNLSSAFDCEGGSFDVEWVGVVNVTESIVLGNGTTVSIKGSYENGLDGSDSSIASDLSDESAAVARDGPAFGPIFLVINASLSLEGIAVRNGNSTVGASMYSSGGGVYARKATVNVTGCGFEDNFGESGGGGIDAVDSSLVVTDTVFRGCSAGIVPDAGAEDVDAKGGSIKVMYGDAFVTRSIFEGCYAAHKGGALYLGWGGLTVADSVFSNNSAGSDNVKDEDPVGEGGAISISRCTGGFQGDGGCVIRDTEFVGNEAARKGGTISLSGNSGRSDVEVSSCTVVSGTAGVYIEDDPQGDGGAFSVGANSSLALVNSTAKGCLAGNKGGAIVLSGGDSWMSPGATLVVINSTFTKNIGDGNSGGVIYCNAYSTVVVKGDGNSFTNNYSDLYGGVLAATSNTSVAVEGGEFSSNAVDENGAVVWTRGDVVVSGGYFHDNLASNRGGVFDTAEDGYLMITGGTFESNDGGDYGGVAYVTAGSSALVTGGMFLKNSAELEGGAFNVQAAADLVITGGHFVKNYADSGGFLFKRGSGNTSCSGASIEENISVDGGGIYASNDASIDWQCDMKSNYALSGCAIFALRSNVSLSGMAFSDPNVLRSSVVMLVSSNLYTFEVTFSESYRSTDLSAVQVGEGSTFYAEETAFVGFHDATVVFNQGEIVLDGCDFRESAAVLLVYVEGDRATTLIRNAALGDGNYAETLEDASSEEVPTFSFINVNLSCTDAVYGDVVSSSQVCSEGSTCYDGDLGVYCQCYLRPSTGAEVCLDDDPAAELTLAVSSSPGETYYPDLPQGDLLLSLSNWTSNASSTSVSGTGVSGDGVEIEGVMWNVTVNASDDMSWTILPSTGLLFPGDSITLRVVSAPTWEFDGSTQFTFRVHGLGLVSEQTLTAETTVDVTFYHCSEGSFWNTTGGEDASKCDLCSYVSGDADGLDCSSSGYSLSTLPLDSGYWRASSASVYIRECYNEDACVGGSDVDSVDDYCDTGYKGPLCGVCSSGYAPSTANTCHRCGEDLRIVMYVIAGLVGLMVIGLIIALGIFLVAGESRVRYVFVSVSSSVGAVGNRWRFLDLAKARGVHPVVRDGGAAADDLSVAPQSTSPPQMPHGGVAGQGQAAAGDGGDSGAARSSCCGRLGDSWCSKGTSRRRCSSPPEPDVRARSASPKKTPVATGDARSVPEPKVPPERAIGLDDSVPSEAKTEDLSRVEEGIGGTPSESVRDGNGWRQRMPRVGFEDDRGVGEQDEKEVDAKRRAVAGDNDEGEGEDEFRGLERQKVLAPIALFNKFSEKIPLSRLKLLIVVWQILAAFVDITQVPMPSIYKSFLSFVGVVTFDLGWIFSAACITEGLNFFEKLLITTIGPMVVFCFLALTFHFGAQRQRRRLYSTAVVAEDGPVRQTAPSCSIASIVRLCLAGESTSKARSSSPLPVRQPTQGEEVSDGAAAVQGAAVQPSRVPADGKHETIPQEQGPETRAVVAQDEERSASEQPGVSTQGSEQELGSGDIKNSDHNEMWWLFARHTTVSLIVLYLIYSEVSTVVLQTFACQDLPEIGKSYLRADLRLECYTSLHDKYQIYAAVMVFVYPLGIPAAFFYLLMRQRSKINPAVDASEGQTVTDDQVLVEKLERRSRDETIASTSFLWDAYYPSRYYYEVCECIRRLLLTGLLVFFDDSTQVAAACFFAFASLVAFEILRPQLEAIETQIYRAGCLVIFLSNFLGLVIDADILDKDSTSSAVYAVILVIINGSLLLATFWDIIVESGISSDEEGTQDKERVRVGLIRRIYGGT